MADLMVKEYVDDEPRSQGMERSSDGAVLYDGQSVGLG